MSTDPPQDSSVTMTVSIEYADPAVLGVDPAENSLPKLIQNCGELLLACGAAPEATRLVITGDFVQSVRDRGEPDSEYHQNYDTRRNNGMVAGKTIGRPDGTVDVLLQAAFFVVDDADGEQDLGPEIAVRTLVHEAQHVVTKQNGEDGETFESAEWARRNFLAAADEVIEEYRAECVATRLVGTGGWNTEDLAGSIRTWLRDLQRIALEEYQEHLDAGRLSYQVLQETHTLWKLLAYVAAELRITSGQLAPGVAEDELWLAMVQPHWDDFVELLTAVPDAQTRVTRDDLNDHAARVANLFTKWLLTVGFEFTDTSDGSAFWIQDWTVLEFDTGQSEDDHGE